VAKSVRKKKQVGFINRLSKWSLRNWPEKWIAKLVRKEKNNLPDKWILKLVRREKIAW
jgi:hypothetical protein